VTIAADISGGERHWRVAAAVALAAHVVIGVLVLSVTGVPTAPQPEPVVLVELPPSAAPAPAATAIAEQVRPVQEVRPEIVPQRTVSPPVDVPEVRAPLPKDAVALAPPAPPRPVRISAPVSQPAQAVQPPPATSAATGTGTGSAETAGDDPRAKAREADYYATLSAHLNRRKRYPTEAKRALQQGVVTVRFTVARDGAVSGVSIKRSSGHDLLDEATMDLLKRVSPLPKFPPSMKRDSVTISLPIEYSLKTR